MYLWVVDVLLEGSLLTSVISVSSTLLDDDDILDVDDESDRVDGGGTCAKADIMRSDRFRFDLRWFEKKRGALQSDY